MKKSEYYEEKLKRERATVVDELGRIGVKNDEKGSDEWAPTSTEADISEADPNEVADKLEIYEENNALVQQLEKRLMEIDAALGKIKNGTFGLCEIDKKPIEEDRLEANPAARTCKKHIES
jgi:RNA polymerase-binding transcription factor DksA